MGVFQRIGMGLLLVASMAVSATAQTLSVPEVLVGGTDVTIGYSGGSPGTTVTVTIDGPQFPVPQTVEIEIQLDQNGNGTATWKVPLLWDFARFTAPGVSEIGRWISTSLPLANE